MKILIPSPQSLPIKGGAYKRGSFSPFLLEMALHKPPLPLRERRRVRGISR